MGNNLTNKKERKRKIKAYKKKEIKERDYTPTHDHRSMSNGSHPFLRRPIMTEDVINRIARHHQSPEHVIPTLHQCRFDLPIDRFGVPG